MVTALHGVYGRGCGGGEHMTKVTMNLGVLGEFGKVNRRE